MLSGKTIRRRGEALRHDSSWGFAALPIKRFIGGYFRVLVDKRQGVLEDALRDGVFVVEQRLIERIDAGT